MSEVDKFEQWFLSCGWDKTNPEFYNQGRLVIAKAKFNQELERKTKASDWLEKNKATVKFGNNGLSKESGKYRDGFLVFTPVTQWIFGETLLNAAEQAMRKEKA